MMLPLMRSRNPDKHYQVTAFGGINPSYSRSINEISAGINMSSRIYPALSSARSHTTDKNTENEILTAGYFDKLYTVEKASDGKVYLCTDNTQTEISQSLAEVHTDRTLAFLKDEILIIPDNVIYHTNTATTEPGCVSESISKTSNQAKFESESGTDSSLPMPYNTWYSAYLTGNSIVSMSAGYRVSSTSYTFYHFSVSGNFAAGDVVTLKMNVKPIDATQDSAYRAYCKKMQDGITLKIKSLTSTRHSTPNGTITEYTSIIFDDNSIDLGGYDEVFVLGVTVEKGIPNFIDICSFENRVWGITSDELCASKLGDSSEWNDFSVDDYGTLPSSCFKTEVESDGDFTAITAYNGHIYAFKEDCIYKVYGSEPAEYSLVKLSFPGVAKGCKDTLASVNGTLYYMSKNGICSFNGSTVRLISTEFNLDVLSADYSGSDERFYYINFQDLSCIYVYDTRYGIWHQISSPESIRSIVMSDEGLKLVTSGSVMSMNTSPSNNWSFAYRFGVKEFVSKHICAVHIRYSLSSEGNVKISLINKHASYELTSAEGEAKDRILAVRIPVSCSEDAELKFEGTGDFVLSSLKVTYNETGIND